MIRIGPAGIPISSEERDTISGIRKTAEIGLNAIEIQFSRSVYLKEAVAKECRKAAEESDVKLSVHGSYFVNLCNPEKAEASKARLMEACYIADVLGASPIVFHPGFYGKTDRKECMKTVLAECNEMSLVIERKGLNVKMGLETTGKASQFGTLEETLEVCRAVKNCIPVIDFAHIYARDGGKIDYAETLRKVSDAGFDSIHSHFSNIEFTDKGERKHLPLDSRPDFRPLAKELVRKGTDITIISESPMLDLDALKMKKILGEEGYNRV